MAAQQADPNSLFHFTQQLITLRRKFAALRLGSFRVFFRADTGVLAFERQLDEERILVFINFTGFTRAASFVRDADPKLATMLLSNVGRKEFYTSYNQFVLNPYEVLLVQVNPQAAESM